MFQNVFKAFLDATFPGITVDDGPLTDVIKLMSSDSPDPVIKSVVSLKGGYDPCTNHPLNSSDDIPTLNIRRRRKRSAGDSQECANGFVTDNSSDYCYKMLSDTKYFEEVDSFCGDLDSSPLSFDNDYQVQGFINLTMQGERHIS